MSILPQSPASTAYIFGQRDAQAGKPCKAAEVFAQSKEQAEYTAGHSSRCNAATAVVAPHYKRDDGEFVRRTDSNVERIFQLAEARDKRIDAMREETASFMGGIFAGDILFA